VPKPKTLASLPLGSPPPNDLEEASLLLAEELQTGDPSVFEPLKTGFADLDEALGGGLHLEDFIILGGPQNVGKTALMLQWAITCARQDALAIVLCYEHSVVLLIQRLLCMISEEIAVKRGKDYRITFVKLRQAYREALLEKGTETKITDVIERLKGGRAAWQLLTELWRNIWLVHGSGNHTDVEAIEGYIKMAKEYLDEKVSLDDDQLVRGKRKVLFVDYTQIVHVRPQHGTWLRGEDKTDFVLVGLNGLSKKHRLPIVAISAAANERLRTGRVHLEDMEASSLMQYEPGTAIILNRDNTREDGARQVRFSLEKNRMGPSELEWSHVYKGEVFTFEPNGTVVSQKDSWQNERTPLSEDGVNG